MNNDLRILFKEKSIDDVQTNLRTKRLAVERKKDELRSLVGERHRDVIAAADSIHVMKNLSTNVLTAIADLDSQCARVTWFNETSNDCIETDTCSELSLAASLKFLNDIPDMVRNFMDSNDCLSSAVLIFVGRYAMTRLKLSAHSNAVNIDCKVLLFRLDDIFDHIESSIVHMCRYKLRSLEEDPRVSCRCLTTLALLERLRAEDILNEYLSGRRRALERILGLEPPSACSTHLEPSYLPVKTQIALVTRFSFAVLRNMVTLFCDEISDSDQTVGSVGHSWLQLRDWSLRSTSWVQDDPLYAHLPEDLLNFKPGWKLSVAPEDSSSGIWSTELSFTHVRQIFSEWWSNVTETCRSVLEKSLTHTSTLTGLVALRAGAIQLLHKFEKDPGCPSGWVSSAHPILQRPVRVWREIFADPFLTQLSILLTRDTDRLLDEWTKEVEHLMVSTTSCMNDDLINSVFADTQFDLQSAQYPSSAVPNTIGVDAGVYNPSALSQILKPENFGLIVFCRLTGRPLPHHVSAATTNAHSTQSPPSQLLVFLQRTTQVKLPLVTDASESSSLGQKLLLVSPTLQNICTALDEKLANLVLTVIGSAGLDWLPSWVIISTAMVRLFERLSHWARSFAYKADCPPGSDTLRVESARGLLVARSCVALTDICSSINAAVVASLGVMECVKPSESKDDIDEETFTWPDMSFLSSAWATTCQPLLQFADRLILDCLSQAILGADLLTNFSERMASSLPSTDASEALRIDQAVLQILAELDPHAILHHLIVPFDSKQLEPGPEEDRLTTTIQVPSSISLPLHEFLLHSVELLNRLVVHLTPRHPLNQELCVRILSALANVYQQLYDTLHDHSSNPRVNNGCSEASLPNDLQPIVLQWIFDLRFLLKLFHGPDRKLASEPNFEAYDMTKQILHTLEENIDLFDREVCFPLLASSVDRCLQSTVQLYAPLSHSHSYNVVSSCKSFFGKDISDQTTAVASFAPLVTAASGTVFPTLPVGLCFNEQRTGKSVKQSKPSVARSNGTTSTHSSSISTLDSDLHPLIT